MPPPAPSPQLFRPLPTDQPEETAAFYAANAPLAQRLLTLLASVAIPVCILLMAANTILYRTEPWLGGITAFNVINLLAFTGLWLGLRWDWPIIPLFTTTFFATLMATAGIAYLLQDLLAYVILVILLNSYMPILPWSPRLVNFYMAAGGGIFILLNAFSNLVGSSADLQIFLIIMVIGSFVITAATHSNILRQRWQSFVAQQRISALNEALSQRTADLEQANHELTLRNEDLDAFARTVAHDLKTPLGAINGYAAILQEMLEDEPLDKEEMEELLGRIERTSLNATEIVQALLLLARVRRQAIQLEPVAMGEVVALARERLALLAAELKADIIAPAVWPTAVGYAPWLVEVWANYLSNALKYGGRPCVVTLGFDELEEGLVRFWVRDNGRGLTPAEQAQLFTEFNRLGEQKVEGHGLGLTIVTGILEKLHGRVGVESTPGAGSCFYFFLPRAG
jgi:signal transduction histidine kinase